LNGGDSFFNTGAAPETLLSADSSVADAGDAICRMLLDIPVPTIAAMHGHAIGGGFLIGLWCDIPVLALENLYGANFMSVGVTPGMGATAALEESLGRAVAYDMLYSGRLLTGQELRTRGAPLPYIIPRDNVRLMSLQLARQLTTVPAQALRLLRLVMSGRRRDRFEATLKDEQFMHQALFAHPATAVTIAKLVNGIAE